MAHHHHDHDHDHDHDHSHDHEHGQRHLHVDEAPLDAANQSLADALRSTFRVLKGVMLLLAIAFLLSGSKRVDENEQAIIVRFGEPVPGVKGPGLSVAWPFPVDETLRLPVKQLKTLQLAAHWPTEEAEQTGLGLDPVRDGALLTGDRGLVHVKWNLTYQIEDIEKFITTLADSDVGQDQRIETLLGGLLRSAAVEEAAAMSAIDVYPRSPEALATRVRVQMNDALTHIGAGIRVVSLDIPDSSVPGPAKNAFLDVTRQQATRQRLIRQAETEAVGMLNGVAGPVYTQLLEKLRMLSLAQDGSGAKGADPLPPVDTIAQEINQLLETEVSGDAGATIAEAKAYYAEVVHNMLADIREYETLLPEYRSNPATLIVRLWSQARRDALDVIGLTKLFLPADPDKEIRLPITPDLEQKRKDDKERLRLESEQRAREQAGEMHTQPAIGRRRR